jgi:nucleoside-diphosphate-sugar epimerase
MTSVLVTGAQGFIGRYLVARYLSADPRGTVVGIGRSRGQREGFTHEVRWGADRITAPLPAPLRAALVSPAYHYVAISLLDRGAMTQLLRACEPQVVVHLAGALRDEPTPGLFEVNVLGTEALLEAIAAAGLRYPPKVIFGSSGSVYGAVTPAALPIDEDTRAQPIDAYAVSKHAAENLALVIAKRHGIALSIARIFNVVGPGQDERHICGWLARQFAEARAGIAKSEITVGPLTTTRDFVDVRDVAAGIHLIASQPRPAPIYNVASGIETEVGQVFARLSKLAGRPNVRPPVPTGGRAQDMPRHVARIDRLRSLGYRPGYLIERSLDDLLIYYMTEVAASNRPKAVA